MPATALETDLSKIRRLPPGVDPAGPIVVYTLHTADECSKELTYGLGDDGRLVEISDSGWSPEEPDQETIRAEILVRHSRGDQDAETLSGDQHRALEDGGLLDDFLVLHAKRDPDGADELLGEVWTESRSP